MHRSGSFDLNLDPRTTAARLGNPRNLILANHAKPVVERSDELPTHTGTWAVIALDQIRMRVEYVVFEPPQRIEVMAMGTGPGSMGKRTHLRFRLAPIARDGTTRVTVEADDTGGCAPRFLTHALWPLWLRQMRRRLEAEAEAD